MTPTTRDLTLLAVGIVVCYLALSLAANWIAPPCDGGQKKVVTWVK